MPHIHLSIQLILSLSCILNKKYRVVDDFFEVIFLQLDIVQNLLDFFLIFAFFQPSFSIFQTKNASPLF